MTTWVIEREDGSQEHLHREPTEFDGFYRRCVQTETDPNIDGTEIWDFDAGQYVTVGQLARNRASREFVTNRGQPSMGEPWAICIQHVRKEMLARLIVAGVSVDRCIVHREAESFGRDVLDWCGTIIAKAEAVDDDELERTAARRAHAGETE